MNPLDPECDKSEASCLSHIAAEPTVDAGPGQDSGGGPVLVVGTTSISMRDTKSVDTNGDGMLQAGEKARVQFAGKNVGTLTAAVVASLENVPSSLTVTDCVENATGTSTACVAACSCDGTISAAKQSVGPGEETANPVLYFYVAVAAGTAAGTIEVPVRFTSTTAGTWHDKVRLVVSP